MEWALLCAMLALVFTLGFFIPMYFSKSISGKTALSLVYKAVPTALAAILSLGACLLRGVLDRYCIFLFVGLCLCTAADVMLKLVPFAGGVLFFCGHLMYVFGLGNYCAPTLWSVAVAVLAWIGLALFARQYRGKTGSVPKMMLVGVVIYSFALAALLGFSLPLPFLAFSPRSVMAALGALLFVFSDMLLSKNRIYKRGQRKHFVSLAVYYLAQFMLALSCWPVS